MRKLLPLFVLLLTACTANVSSEPVTLRWAFSPDAASTEDMPMTDVSLVVSGAVETTVDLGVYGGQGAQAAESAWGLPEGALTTAVLWWAGGGDELAVFRTDEGKLTVRHRGIDEQSGYSTFTDKATLDVPKDAEVVVAE